MPRRVILVAGPPCAGKSTYVAQRAEPGDLVLDQDAIGAQAMRQGIARVAAMSDGTAWVIRCCPGPQRRQAFAEQIRATDVVLLTAPELELIARATQRPNPRRHIQAIRDWIRREAQDAPPAGAGGRGVRGGPAPRSRHRVGRPYQRARRQMFAIYGTVCVHCGHGGAREADHLMPVAYDPDQPIDPHLMRPSHGSNYPCPVCPSSRTPGRGRACNQERGTRPIESMYKPAIDW